MGRKRTSSWKTRTTQRRLDDRGADYDGLHMGKPLGDLWIDDRAARFENRPDTLEQVDRILS